jgi:hypothetical protein
VCAHLFFFLIFGVGNIANGVAGIASCCGAGIIVDAVFVNTVKLV